MKNSLLLILSLFIVTLLACQEEDGPTPGGSTANTVAFFSEFSTRTPLQEKVVDKEGNVYTYITNAGTYEVGLGSDSRFEVTRNNTLVKLNSQGKFVTKYEGVVPLSFNKLVLGNDDQIYMKSEVRNSASIIKLRTDGSFNTANRITSYTVDLAATGRGDYFVLEPNVKKYTVDNKLIWSSQSSETEEGGNTYGFRIEYNEIDESLYVLGQSSLVKYDANDGKQLWSYPIEGMVCGKVFSDPTTCISGFMKVDDSGSAYLAYIKNGIKDGSNIEFVEVVKLDANGSEVFAKTMRSEAAEPEDIYVTGLTVYQDAFYMAINKDTPKSGRGFESGYVGKYDGSNGNEIWRQAPSWEYVSIGQYAPSKFDFTQFPVFIKDLVQDETDGSLWFTTFLGLPTVISDPESSGSINDVMVRTRMGNISYEQEMILSVQTYRNLVSLNP